MSIIFYTTQNAHTTSLQTVALHFAVCKHLATSRNKYLSLSFFLCSTVCCMILSQYLVEISVFYLSEVTYIVHYLLFYLYYLL